MAHLNRRAEGGKWNVLESNMPPGVILGFFEWVCMPKFRVGALVGSTHIFSPCDWQGEKNLGKFNFKTS